MPNIPEPVIDGWYDLLDEGGLVLALDPGANTGLVCFYVPSSLSTAKGRWVGSTTVTPSASEKFNHAHRDLDFQGRIAAAMSGLRADAMVGEVYRELDLRDATRDGPQLPDGASKTIHVALEEPLDATLKWRGGAHKQSTGTAFRLGAYYMAAVGAVAETHRISPVAQIASYPVTNHGGRIGWMQGAGKRVGKREHVHALILQEIRLLGAPTSGLTDHEIAAAGVGLFHLSQIHQARMARKISQVKKQAEADRKAEEREKKAAEKKAKKAVEKAARKAGAL